MLYLKWCWSFGHIFPKICLNYVKNCSHLLQCVGSFSASTVLFLFRGTWPVFPDAKILTFVQNLIHPRGWIPDPSSSGGTGLEQIFWSYVWVRIEFGQPSVKSCSLCLVFVIYVTTPEHHMCNCGKQAVTRTVRHKFRASAQNCVGLILVLVGYGLGSVPTPGLLKYWNIPLNTALQFRICFILWNDADGFDCCAYPSDYHIFHTGCGGGTVI